MSSVAGSLGRFPSAVRELVVRPGHNGRGPDRRSSCVGLDTGTPTSGGLRVGGYRACEQRRWGVHPEHEASQDTGHARSHPPTSRRWEVNPDSQANRRIQPDCWGGGCTAALGRRIPRPEHRRDVVRTSVHWVVDCGRGATRLRPYLPPAPLPASECLTSCSATTGLPPKTSTTASAVPEQLKGRPWTTPRFVPLFELRAPELRPVAQPRAPGRPPG